MVSIIATMGTRFDLQNVAIVGYPCYILMDVGYHLVGPNAFNHTRR